MKVKPIVLQMLLLVQVDLPSSNMLRVLRSLTEHYTQITGKLNQEKELFFLKNMFVRAKTPDPVKLIQR